MIIHGDSLHELEHLGSDSVDFVCTDPPYGYSFMGKDWDRAVPSVEIWQQCLRVLKPGAFMCVMSAPRSDVQNAMISRLMEAGFRLDFTPIYWTYASGFPKAGNIGKLVDKRRGDDPRPVCRYLRAAMDKQGKISSDLAPLFDCNPRLINHWAARETDSQPSIPTWEQWLQLKDYLKLDDSMDAEVWRLNGRKGTPGEAWAEREVVGQGKGHNVPTMFGNGSDTWDVTTHASDAAKALDGSYAGFQPKPAVEVIIVAMKPLSEKTYVNQALSNGHGVSWLDDARIPSNRTDTRHGGGDAKVYGKYADVKGYDLPQGRFPANLLVSDDVLNDGKNYNNSKGGSSSASSGYHWKKTESDGIPQGYGDSGSYSRYFDLDKWAATLPFLITPKASKSEKNKGLEHLPKKQAAGGGGGIGDYADDVNSASGKYGSEKAPANNFHPTVKPLKLMSYLITLFSRPGDTVLDPFCGSGSTNVAAHNLGRETIGIEREAEYVEIARARLAHVKPEVVQLPPEQPVPAEPPQTLEAVTDVLDSSTPQQISLL